MTTSTIADETCGSNVFPSLRCALCHLQPQLAAKPLIQPHGFEQRLSPMMHQKHAVGDKAFVDYSGKKVPIVDRQIGEVREAELLSACSARRVTPSPRRLGPRHCRIG